jgi:hypothetical protein
VLGRLVEPQRQLLITHPRLFSNALWTLTNATILGGFACPFVNNLGVNTNEGFKFTATAANATLKLTTPYTTTAASTYTNSVFLKRVTGTGNVFIEDVNDVDRAVILTTAWQRFEYAAAASGATGQCGIKLATSGDEVMVCHIQPESNVNSDSTATSTIYGVEGSLLTRNADLINKTSVGALIGQDEGTIYAEINWNERKEIGSPVTGIVTLNNNVNNLNNCILIGIERRATLSNQFFSLIQVGNSAQAVLIGLSVSTGFYKIALAYKQNDFALYVNGVSQSTANSGNVPTTNEVRIGTRFSTDVRSMHDSVTKAVIFKTRLSNIQLQQLTTL